MLKSCSFLQTSPTYNADIHDKEAALDSEEFGQHPLTGLKNRKKCIAHQQACQAQDTSFDGVCCKAFTMWPLVCSCCTDE
jgi:hypothetical protein